MTDDLRRSRLLVFFRLLLAIPHLIWLLLWSLVAIVVAFLTWIWALVTGTPPRPFHRFLSRYVRYVNHVYAFLFLVGNPFPGFVGKPGSYPIELELPPLERQNRWVTGFRGLLAAPAFLIGGGLGGALLVAAFLGWFVGLFLGRMPQGLRDLGAYALRYQSADQRLPVLHHRAVSGLGPAPGSRFSLTPAARYTGRRPGAASRPRNPVTPRFCRSSGGSSSSIGYEPGLPTKPREAAARRGRGRHRRGSHSARSATGTGGTVAAASR